MAARLSAAACRRRRDFRCGWWLSSVAVNLVRKAITRARGDAGVTTFLASLLNILLKAIIAIMAIAQLGIDVTSLIAALGTAGRGRGAGHEGQHEQCGERRADCAHGALPCGGLSLRSLRGGRGHGGAHRNDVHHAAHLRQQGDCHPQFPAHAEHHHQFYGDENAPP